MGSDNGSDMRPGRIFDGHNDNLSCLMRAGGVSAAGRFLEQTDHHLDQPKARAGNFGGGFLRDVGSVPRRRRLSRAHVAQ